MIVIENDGELINECIFHENAFYLIWFQTGHELLQSLIRYITISKSYDKELGRYEIENSNVTIIGIQQLQKKFNPGKC